MSSGVYPTWHRTKLRKPLPHEKPLGGDTILRVYVLVTRHECPKTGYKLRCACPGTLIVVRDGHYSYGRYYVTCSAHGTRTYYGDQEKAIKAAKDCSFCRECRAAVVRYSKCPSCGAPERGCVLCETR